MAEGSRLVEGARAVREHVSVEWDEARVETLRGRMHARRRRRAVLRATMAAAAVIAVALTASYLVWPGEQRSTPRVAARSEHAIDDGIIRLADGSTVTPLDDDTQVIVERVNAAEIQLDLRRGGARFDVVRGLPRAFRVRAGVVEVSVVGTVFEVRRDGNDADVRVIEGRVRVAWPPDGEAFVAAGESGRFPRAPEIRAGASAPAVIPARAARVRAPRASHAAWVELAERGEYQQAVGLLESDPGALASSDLDTLLLASDTMRLTGRPERALAFLDRAESIAAGDARASLVAFTRGRLLLGGLSRPREAAAAFAHARELAPEGSLAMDALAREVEALSRAGDRDAAHARAEEYVARYPNGLRIDAVRRWGGLAPP